MFINLYTRNNEGKNGEEIWTIDLRGKKTPQPKKKRIYLGLKSANMFSTQNAIHTLPLQIVQLDFNIQYQTYSLETD